MPNSEEEFSNNPGFLKYKIEQIEKVLYPLISSVDNLNMKVSLLAQKIFIATLLIGGAFQVFGLWYSNRHSEDDKKSYYESRISDSDKVKELQAEIDRLKKGGK